MTRGELGDGRPGRAAAMAVGRRGGTVAAGAGEGCGRDRCCRGFGEALVRAAPSEVWSTIVCSVGCYGDRGHDGDIAGGVELSAKVGLWPRGRERPGEKGETIRGLTAVAVGVEAGSETRWRRRIRRR